VISRVLVSRSYARPRSEPRRDDPHTPRAIAQSKRAISIGEEADLRTARRFGIEALRMLVGGDEWREGMNAFVEKRPPRFDEW
jgi:1,4-dihydroxy-2-naphthoyl-CoA synthase